MTSLGGLTGFWVIAMLTLYGEAQGHSLNEPDVPFPPACPTAQNLAAICHQGQGRPRYPASFFPVSGASHFRRCGNAINRLESWYSLCCSGHAAQQSQLLCCAQQAWKQALSKFCAEEYSTMTVPYECCEDRGDARWKCFDSELPNPNYSSTPGYTAPQLPAEPGFTFDSNAC
ncbi:extracellular matrix protein 1-like [Solea senegalensis]|uniref:Extracellular matrix protein 1-like n=1 Tax=Solea senegalensis TaxID=28829 RepID=A0AAV6R6P2_SOLSE|nr:extracellular matrix protein 1 [Solea senegalensis]KAG7501112.1 extracellular matrix protein 1-like [Solea senegalensis]